MSEPFEDIMRRGGSVALQEAERFFMKEDRVFQSLRKITRRLDELKIAYAVAGGLALVAHGYERTTVDVDILLTSEGLEQAHRALDDLGYVSPFNGSKYFRDTQTFVRIRFDFAGDFPGDGKPKPVSFPDPAAASVELDGIKYLRLPTLIELKLASGMTNPGRLKDLGDVQELIRALRLPREFGDELNPYVRDKFGELWSAVHDDPTTQEQ
jgi:hypothetical protein